MGFRPCKGSRGRGARGFTEIKHIRYGLKEHKTTEKPQRLQGSERQRERGFRYGGERHSTGWNLRALPSSPRGACQGATGAVQGCARRGHRRADQGPKPPSPLPSSGSGAVLAGGFGKKSRLDPSPHHHHHADHHPVRSGAGVSGLSGYTQPHGIRPPPKP